MTGSGPSVVMSTVVELRVPPPPPLFSQCEAHGPPNGVGREQNMLRVIKIWGQRTSWDRDQFRSFLVPMIGLSPILILVAVLILFHFVDSNIHILLFKAGKIFRNYFVHLVNLLEVANLGAESSLAPSFAFQELTEPAKY